MTKDLGKINAVKHMIDSLEDFCQKYEICKQLTSADHNPPLKSATLDELCKYRERLEEALDNYKNAP